MNTSTIYFGFNQTKKVRLKLADDVVETIPSFSIGLTSAIPSKYL